MINKKLDNIEEEIRQINNLINDNDYFKQIEKAIDIVNNKNDELSKKNKELQDRIQKALEYIYTYYGKQVVKSYSETLREIKEILEEGE